MRMYRFHTISSFHRIGLWLTVFLVLASPAWSDDAVSEISAGDTAWLLTATSLVLMMTAPGLALFYGGLVSQRNVLATLMFSFFCMCLIGVQWVLWGYSLAFGDDIGGIIGNLKHFAFMGVGPEASGSIPALVFAMFQGAFAIITVALISGCFVERISFPAFVLFSVLWSTLVYDPLAHWVWSSDGWLFQLGTLDFAGGTVVHISSGVSALVACLIIGRRLGYPRMVVPPHSLPLTVVGAALLWIGWFGFNAGSSLAANGIAAVAFATTNTAAAVAGLTWAFLEWILRGKPTMLGAATGVVAGLVGITPGAGFVSVPSSLAIGFTTAVFCYIGVNVLKNKFGYDDSLDVFGVHGIGGTWGALATGIFCSAAVNSAAADGLIYGNPAQLGKQLIGVLAGYALAVVGTFVILNVVKLITPLRVTPDEEVSGLDLALHGEVAYNFLAPGMSQIARTEEN
ncbi:MAG: ammonium transporter [Candidatus Omnitrophica bacterium]|nr:ammonium transporter [Candidatus Omnitrophota bacterium]